MAGLDLLGLHVVLDIDQAAETVLGTGRFWRNQLRRLTPTQMHDVFVIQRLPRIDEPVACGRDLLAKRNVSSKRPQLDECQPLELPRLAAGSKVMTKAVQRTSQRAGFAVRTQPQVDLKNTFAA